MPGYATIKPVSGERDRGSMLSHLDLWSCEDVVRNKDDIPGSLTAGNMPYDGPWPAEQIELFRAWVAAGTPA